MIRLLFRSMIFYPALLLGLTARFGIQHYLLQFKTWSSFMMGFGIARLQRFSSLRIPALHSVSGVLLIAHLGLKVCQCHYQLFLCSLHFRGSWVTAELLFEVQVSDPQSC